MTPIDPSEKKQPVVLVTRPAAGGIRSHIVQLLKYIDRSRYSVILAAPDDLIASLARESLPDYEAIPLPISARLSFTDLTAASRLAALIANTGALVHAHGIRGGFIAALAQRCGWRFPLVVTYHNVPPNTRLGRLALRCASSRASAQIAVSGAISTHLPNFPAARVIPNGVEVDHFLVVDKMREQQRNSGMAGDRFTVGAVARLSPEKGIDVLLEAARRTPRIRYLVGGTGPEESKLKAMAPSNVKLLGYLPDTRTLYAASDIVAIPSRSEGQGIVALEAMVSGVAVIASRIGGLAETIDSGKSGILVEPQNPDELANSILILEQDAEVRRALAEFARMWALKHAVTQARVNEIEGVYKEIASLHANT